MDSDEVQKSAHMADSDEHSELLIQAKNIEEKYYNIGYREGLLTGKMEVIQVHFDYGYFYACLYHIRRSIGDLNGSYSMPRECPPNPISSAEEHEEFKKAMRLKFYSRE